MNAGGAFLTFLLTSLICTLPRRLAAVPLLMAASYMPREAVLEIASVHVSVLHLLVLFGILRTIARREGLAHGVHSIDRLMIGWACILLASTAFHSTEQWAFRCGMVWSQLGVYLLLRIFIQDTGDIEGLFKAGCLILVPVAVLMLLEKSLQHNFFAALGGHGDVVIRDGHARARGPFAHPILAGTVGATAFPMALYLWNRHRFHALCGLFSAVGIVGACTSSGPVMMILFTVAGLLLWRVRDNMRAIRWLAATGLVVLDTVMNDPVYYLMARIDLTGNSQGWYRARLIQSAIEHLDEWWLAGTDHTRHWMPTGIHANEVHADITNHLLGMGVTGGLPLMLVFVLILISAFRLVGQGMNDGGPARRPFLMWTLGAMLFGHVVNFFSISLFDQSVVFFYLVVAAIGTAPDRRQPATPRYGPAPAGPTPAIPALVRTPKGLAGTKME